MPNTDATKTDFGEPGQPIIHPASADQALRDLMPVVEWLTNHGLAMHDGAASTASYSLTKAVEAFDAIPARSPSISAYMNWLTQNTRAEDRRKP